MEHPLALDVGPLSELLILAGKTLLECGGETSRVEETMTRMALACGFESANVLANTTGIYLTLITNGTITTRVLAVYSRSIDLGKVAFVNEISRQLEEHSLQPGEAMERLRQIDTLQPHYRFRWMLLARGLSSASFALLLGGTAPDFLPAMLSGFGVQIIIDRLEARVPGFLAIFFCTLLGTAWAVASVHWLHFGHSLSAVVVGVIVPLVPGMAITSAVRDLIAGHLISGVARSAEALMVAVAIAAGVSSVLSAVPWVPR